MNEDHVQKIKQGLWWFYKIESISIWLVVLFVGISATFSIFGLHIVCVGDLFEIIPSDVCTECCRKKYGVADYQYFMNIKQCNIYRYDKYNFQLQCAKFQLHILNVTKEWSTVCSNKFIGAPLDPITLKVDI